MHFQRAAYKFCWQSNLSISNYAMVIPFCILLLQLVTALVSVFAAAGRLQLLNSSSPAFSALLRHVAYVVIFFILWLLQVRKACMELLNCHSFSHPSPHFEMRCLH